MVKAKKKQEEEVKMPALVIEGPSALSNLSAVNDYDVGDDVVKLPVIGRTMTN